MEKFGAGTEDRNSLEVPGLEVRMSLTRILNKCCGMAWTWFTWLRKGTRGGHVWAMLWTPVLHFMGRSYWLSTSQLFSQEILLWTK